MKYDRFNRLDFGPFETIPPAKIALDIILAAGLKLLKTRKTTETDLKHMNLPIPDFDSIIVKDLLYNLHSINVDELKNLNH